MKILFVTNNKHKLKEIRSALNDRVEVFGLNDVDINEEIPEPFCTLEENAVHKARTIFLKYNLNCFADDTGLEVSSLNGKPGVYSSRFAGEGCSFDDNINKLLSELKGIKNRKARFRTVLALIEAGNIKLFEGIVEGRIAEKRTGEDGFGYDPVFIPDGYSKSFAEMSLDEKNKISHRTRALNKLINYLNSTLSK
jgi:XTP/dITP diphosphohydrolase